MIPDLLVENSSASIVWQSVPNDKNFSEKIFPSPFKLRVPHSSAFVDLDKDFFAGEVTGEFCCPICVLFMVFVDYLLSCSCLLTFSH